MHSPPNLAKMLVSPGLGGVAAAQGILCRSRELAPFLWGRCCGGIHAFVQEALQARGAPGRRPQRQRTPTFSGEERPHDADSPSRSGRPLVNLRNAGLTYSGRLQTGDGQIMFPRSEGAYDKIDLGPRPPKSVLNVIQNVIADPPQTSGLGIPAGTPPKQPSTPSRLLSIRCNQLTPHTQPPPAASPPQEPTRPRATPAAPQSSLRPARRCALARTWPRRPHRHASRCTRVGRSPRAGR